MIIVDVADGMSGVVVKLQSLSEVVYCILHVLCQRGIVGNGVTFRLSDVPEVSGAKKRVEGGIAGIILNGSLKLRLYLGNAVVIVTVINGPETNDGRGGH